jgi:surface polysaccharide O-acyltransferase-like enzyme
MGLDTDNVFQELFDEQTSKIPVLFRMNKKRRKVQLIILSVLAVFAVILLVTFYSTGRYEQLESDRGPGFNDYDYEYLIAFIVVMVVTAVLSLWMVIAELLEKRAFAKASRLANMIYLSERHRNEIRRQNDRLLKRF